MKNILTPATIDIVKKAAIELADKGTQAAMQKVLDLLDLLKAQELIGGETHRTAKLMANLQFLNGVDVNPECSEYVRDIVCRLRVEQKEQEKQPCYTKLPANIEKHLVKYFVAMGTTDRRNGLAMRWDITGKDLLVFNVLPSAMVRELHELQESFFDRTKHTADEIRDKVLEIIRR
jgi:hypothetical protein